MLQCSKPAAAKCVLDIAVLATDPTFTEQYVTAHSLLQKTRGYRQQNILEQSKYTYRLHHSTFYRDITMTSQLTV